MQRGASELVDMFSDACLFYAGRKIRCDVGESELEIELASGGIQRSSAKNVLVMKQAIPAGVKFTIGAKVDIAGQKLEIYRIASEDEISITLVVGTPGLGK